VLTRRDRCDFVRKIYRKMIDLLFDGADERAITGVLFDGIERLYTGQVPFADLVIYVGINTLQHLAKHRIEADGTRVYLDERGNPIGVNGAGDTTTPVTGPLDPRLVYPNLVHSLLALKMLRRGTDVPPGTRLEYILLENDRSEHVGDKAEDYAFFLENRRELGLRPDYAHYLEKHLMQPIMELLRVMFPKETVYHQPLDEQWAAFEAGRHRHLPNAPSRKLGRMARVRRLTKTVVGDAAGDDATDDGNTAAGDGNTATGDGNATTAAALRVYSFQGAAAKREFVLAEARSPVVADPPPTQTARNTRAKRRTRHRHHHQRRAVSRGKLEEDESSGSCSLSDGGWGSSSSESESFDDFSVGMSGDESDAADCGDGASEAAMPVPTQSPPVVQFNVSALPSGDDPSSSTLEVAPSAEDAFRSDADRAVVQVASAIKARDILAARRRSLGVGAPRAFAPGVSGPALRDRGTEVVVWVPGGVNATERLAPPPFVPDEQGRGAGHASAAAEAVEKGDAAAGEKPTKFDRFAFIQPLDAPVNVAYKTPAIVFQRHNAPEWTKAQPAYLFDVCTRDGMIVRGLRRSEVTPYRTRDDMLMKTVIAAHQAHDQVVRHIRREGVEVTIED
jgi:hypothetical protein